MSFARDAATHAYYDARAAEYDEWYEGEGRFADRDRPGWAAEVEELVALVDGLAPARTLDVACGTAFLTRHLHGFAVGLDQSPAMVALAREHFSAFRKQASSLPVSLRPAFLPLALTGAYLDRIERLGAAAATTTPRIPLWRRHWLIFRRASRGW